MCGRASQPLLFQVASPITSLPSGSLLILLRRNGPHLCALQAHRLDSFLAPLPPCLLLFHYTPASPLDSGFSQGCGHSAPAPLASLRPDHVSAHGATPTLPLRFSLKL